MGVQVVDWGINTVHRHLHQRTAPSPDGATMSAPSDVAPSQRFQRRYEHHVPTRVPVLHHHHTAAASDNETVTVSVISREAFSGVSLYLVDSAPIASNHKPFPSTALRRHQQTRCPVSQLDLLYCVTDTVRGSRTCGLME